jgi:hypothetical protein
VRRVAFETDSESRSSRIPANSISVASDSRSFNCVRDWEGHRFQTTCFLGVGFGLICVSSQERSFVAGEEFPCRRGGEGERTWMPIRKCYFWASCESSLLVGGCCQRMVLLPTSQLPTSRLPTFRLAFALNCELICSKRGPRFGAVGISPCLSWSDRLVTFAGSVHRQRCWNDACRSVRGGV